MTRTSFVDAPAVDYPHNGQWYRIFGAYDPLRNRITVLCGGRTRLEIMRTLTHEQQHAKDRPALLFSRYASPLAFGITGWILFWYKWLLGGTSATTEIALFTVMVTLFLAGPLLNRWAERRAFRAENKYLAHQIMMAYCTSRQPLNDKFPSGVRAA